MNERASNPGEEVVKEKGDMTLVQKATTGSNGKALGIGLLVLALILIGYWMQQRSAANQAAMLAALQAGNAQIAQSIRDGNAPPPPDLPEEFAMMIKETGKDMSSRFIGKVFGRELGDSKAGEAVLLAIAQAPKYFGEVGDRLLDKFVDRPYTNQANIAVNTTQIAGLETRTASIEAKTANLQAVNADGSIFITPRSSAIVWAPRQAR